MTAALKLRRRQEDRTALSDKLMIKAAVGLLVERGISGTTLAAIGERSGYSRGLATHRFGSKAGLLAHVHDSVATEWLRRVQQKVGEATGIVALQRVTDALYDFILDEPEELRAMYLLRYVSIDPGAEYRANVAKVNRAHIRALQRWVEEGKADGAVAAGVDARLAAELFASLVDGLLYRWLVNPDIPVKALHALLRREVARALRAADTPLGSAGGRAGFRRATLD
jgi:AcrR family transcriptional regulator